MNGNSSNSRGFTIVEMMIVVVIIGIMTSLAAPKFGRMYDRMKMRAAVRDIASDFRLARSKAITDKEQYALYFDPSNRTITIFKDKSNPALYQFESADSVVIVDTLPPEFIWSYTDCANNVIAFKPNGAAGFSGGGNVWVVAISHDAVCVGYDNVLASTGRLTSQTWVY